jgi:hypothetical protein
MTIDPVSFLNSLANPIRRIAERRQSIKLSAERLVVGKVVEWENKWVTGRSELEGGGSIEVNFGKERKVDPTSLYAACINRGRIPAVVERFRVFIIMEKPGLIERIKKLADQPWRENNRGLPLAPDDLVRVEIQLWTEPGQSYQPGKDETGIIEAVTTRGKTFHSPPFRFGELA